MKRYVILIAYRPWDWSSATPEVRQSYVDAHDAFQQYVDEHGAHLGSAALGDADTATTLRADADGARMVTDGPFAELAEQIGGYYDVELPDQPPIRESDTFGPGEQLVTYSTEQARLGLSICYDLRFPELYRGLMVLGAEVFCVPAQFQHTTGIAHWKVLLRARAIENQCFVLAAGQWGAYGREGSNRRSYGHSMIVDPWGRVLEEAPEEGDGVGFANLDLSELQEIRTRLPALQHRRLGLT